MRGVEESRAPAFRSVFFRQYLEQEIQGEPARRSRALSRATARRRRHRDRPADAERALADGRRGIAGAGGRVEEVGPPRRIAGPVRIRRNCRSTSRACTSGAKWTSTGTEACTGGTTWRLSRTARRTAPSPASTRISTATTPPASTACSTTAGTNAATDCGTRIVRDGVSIEVHRDTRGTRLESGDEIHLGRAVVVFVE